MKKNITIKYFFNFREDNRRSMETVSNYLFNFFKNERRFKISKFVPTFFKKNQKIISHAWNLRFNRYVNYPNQVKKLKKVDVAHVIDHQYAHLVHNINAKYKIITVHDLIPIKFSKEIGKNPYLVKHSHNYLKYFNQIIAVSENTKRDIIKYTDCPSKKIKVLYSSVEKNFNHKKIDKKSICKKYKIPFDHKKILIIGSSFYKNHKISIKVLKKLKKIFNNKISLVKLGNKLDFKIENELKQNIIELKHLKREKISDIYKICDVLLFPSIYEGYGLPLIEAINSELPIVASNIKTTKEILNNYPLLFNPKDSSSMSLCIEKLINNKNFNLKIKKKLNLRKNNFKEEIYFTKLKNLYLKGL